VFKTDERRKSTAFEDQALAQGASFLNYRKQRLSGSIGFQALDFFVSFWGNRPKWAHEHF